MKKAFRIAAVFFACAMIGSVAAGCQKKTPDTETDLEISFLTAGVGEKFLDGLAAGFKEVHPEITVHLKPTASFGTFNSTITAGAGANTVDLYLMQDSTVAKYVGMKEKYIEPLDDVLAHGETGKTIGDRLNADYKSSYTIDGSVYSLPWQPFAHGIVYNHKKMVTEMGLSVPRTTNELLTLSATIAGRGEVPFIHNQSGYWSYALNGWWAQYEGMDGFFDFFDATSYVGGEKVYPSKDVFTQQGRYEALEVLGEICAYDDKGKQKYIAVGSNSDMHTVAQTKFLNGAALMTPNAGWLETEMKNEMKSDMDFRFMRLPVVSSVVDHLSFHAESDAAKEEKLIALIDYVDGGMTGSLPAGTTPDDATRVAEARSVTVGEAAFISHAVVPSYANAKGAAKEFLKYMYSDEGLALLTANFNAMPLVAFADESKIPDKSGWSTLARTHDMLKTGARYAYNPNTCPVFYNNNVKPFRTSPELVLGASNVKERMSAYVLFQDEANYAASKWDDWTRGIV